MKRVQHQKSMLPYILLAPQICIICIFFLWPAFEAIKQSFLLEDAFGISSQFVWFRNYQDMIFDVNWLNSALVTVIIALCVTFFSMSIALLLAVKANEVLQGQSQYKVLLMWAYAIAPPVAGLMGSLFFNPLIGDFYHFLHSIGWKYDHIGNVFDAIFLVVLVAVWKQVSINFIFFLAGLQGVSRSVQEAASIDCRSSWKRFWTIVFPLLAPTTFFLLVINVIYAFFDTLGIIDTTTVGQPGDATKTLVYKVYVDGFLGNDLGGSSAQSVILLVIVSVLTIIQFRFIERKVHY